MGVMTTYFEYFGRVRPFTAIQNYHSGKGSPLPSFELMTAENGDASGVRPLSSTPPRKSHLSAGSVRVLIVDDHPLIADAIAECVRTINTKADVVQVAEFEDAVKLAAAEQFDLVLLEYRLSGIHGLQNLRLMRGRFPDLRIAMISGIAEGPQIVEAMSLGAVGFILLELPVPALIKALELILLGESFVPAKALRRSGMGDGTAPYDIASVVPKNHRPQALTPREVQVPLLVEMGKSNKEIADDIGTKDMTVAFHLKNAFRKLGVKNRTQAASAVRKLSLAAMKP